MSEESRFKAEVKANVDAIGRDEQLKQDTLDWMIRAGGDYKYSYNFAWMGRPISQYPQDMVGMQELIWRIRPDLVVEMGIAHGGSLIFNASMLALLEYSEAVDSGEAHPMSSRVDMIQGSSIDEDTIRQVREYAAGYETVLVILDSNHTHEHVLAELEAYADLTSVGSYCIVFDTVVEDAPEKYFADRPWGKGDNPKTAVWEYLKSHPEFEIDKEIENKLLITVAPDGFLRRVS
jgi:cephalosporin hydroxylase